MSRFGSLGTQYFDNAGDPLTAGKIYFYESGTLTAKDTYSDVGLTTLNTNPVILDASGRQGDIFFSGTAKAILKDQNDVQVEVRDPLGGAASDVSFPDWASDAIYNIPDIVVGSDLNFYVSITDSNQGNDPTSSAANWTQVNFIRTWNTNETYAIGDIVKASDNLLYSAVTGSNQGNTPVGDTTNWQKAVVDDAGWLYKASDYNILANEKVVANINSGTITLPTTLTVGASFEVSNMHSSTLTIADNGNTIQYKGTSYTSNVTLAQGDTISLVANTTSTAQIV